MKRKLSVLLAGMLLSQSVNLAVVNADEITGIYADIYEISVNSDFNASEEDVALLLEEKSVAVNVNVTGKNISITPENGYFERDKVYKLKVGAVEKEFKIKTLFSESFDEIQNGDIDGTVSNFYGNMNFVSPENGNAFYQDNKLVLADSFMSISDFEQAEGENITFSADVEGYGKKGVYISNGKPINVPIMNAGYMISYMGIGGEDKLSVAGADAIELQQSIIKSGFFNSNCEYETDYSCKYPPIPFKEYEENEKKDVFGFSKVINTDVLLHSYSYEKKSDTRSVAVRKTSDKLHALFNGEDVISFGDETAEANLLSFKAGGCTVLVLDNILITCYTEDVAEPEKGEVKALELEGDFDGLYLSFDRTLKGTSDFSKLHVYKDDEEVKKDISFADGESTIIKIVPEGYYAGHTYKVVVEEGFGTKHMWTYEETTYEKYLEPQCISVTSSEINAQGIRIDFDSNIPTGADKNKIKVYKNNEECTASVMVYETWVSVIPEGYELNNKYKVVIESGFGSKNIYLEENYTFEGEYLKAEVFVEKIAGNSGVVYVTFSEDISDVKDLNFVGIYKDDKKLEADVTLSGNVITIKTGIDFETDEVYEIYIGRFETENAVMKKAIRKQFTMKQILFEDFEDNELAEGVSAGGKIIADENKVSGISDEDAEQNKRRIIYNGELSISHSEIINAENYDITFDFQMFNANLNNDNKKYTDSVPYSNWYYNRKDTTTAYKIYVNPSTARNQTYNDKEGTWKDFSQQEHLGWVNGDAYYDKQKDKIFIYDLGDELPFEKNTRTHSERSIPEPKEVKIKKNGKNLYVWYDGSLYMKSEPGEKEPEYLTGALLLQNQITEIVSYDNVCVRKFELIDFEKIEISSGEVAAESNGVITGSFKIGNYTPDDKKVKVAACAYGEDNLMQTMEILDISEVKAGEKQTVDFSLDKVENVKKVTFFVWKDLTDFENYAVYTTTIQ